ncbi:MAG: hypothetical protein R3B90_22690, partial [Planctomycetaceae bacterium]
AFPLPVSGLDVINLGAVGVAGNNIVSTALGVKYKPLDNVEVGVAYEVPVTNREDVLGDRFTFDLIYRY